MAAYDGFRRHRGLVHVQRVRNQSRSQVRAFPATLRTFLSSSWVSICSWLFANVVLCLQWTGQLLHAHVRGCSHHMFIFTLTLALDGKHKPSLVQWVGPCAFTTKVRVPCTCHSLSTNTLVRTPRIILA